MSAITAAAAGFDVVHLGADVPFAEVIRLALIRRPVAILLSFVFNSANERLLQGLLNLREMIDPDTRIFIGGRSAGWYGNRLNGTGIQHLNTLSDLRDALVHLSSTY
jgi:methylmalonyl-CoA mutase cobalamin-binding subunit